MKYRIESVIQYRAFIEVEGKNLQDCLSKAREMDHPNSWTPMEAVWMQDPDGDRCVKLKASEPERSEEK